MFDKIFPTQKQNICFIMGNDICELSKKSSMKIRREKND